MTTRRVLNLLASAAVAVCAAPALANASMTTAANVHKTITCVGANRSVTIDGSRDTIALKGSCAQIHDSGSRNVITAASIRTLDVSGDDEVVHVTKVAVINVSGIDDHVTYRRSFTGDAAQTHVTGTNNHIIRN